MNRETKQLHPKVLLIAPQPFYAERGTPMNVRLMATILGKEGYRVDLLVFPTGDDLVMKNVRVIRLPNLLRTRKIPIGFSFKKLFFDLLLPFWGMWLCFSNRYAVVHGIEEGGVIAVLLSRCFRGAGSVYDMDSNISEQFKKSDPSKISPVQKLIHIVEQLAIRNASVVITVCSALTRDANKAAPRGPVVQIEDIPLSFAFPVDLERVGAIRSRVRQIAEDFGLVNGKIVLYTGNLQSYQGIDLLLDAWGEYQRTSPDRSHRLVVIGGPKEAADAYTAQLQSKPWNDTVVFTGPRPAEEMDAWMGYADCLVSPRSQGENTPLKIYSYMASGKPIIATRRNTHTQVLDDHSAFLVAPDAGRMAAAIARALTDEEEAAIRGDLASQVVRQKYSYETFKSKLLYAYTQAERVSQR